jgi:hypothetical protein
MDLLLTYFPQAGLCLNTVNKVLANILFKRISPRAERLSEVIRVDFERIGLL